MRRLLGLLLTGLVVGLSGPAPTHGQSAYDLFGSARASGLGYASTALADAVGVHANPAAGALHRKRAVSFFGREGFGLSALHYGSVYGTWPVRWGVVSSGASTFGGDAYRDVHFSFGYARGLKFGTTRQVYVGLTGRYYHTRIDEYGSAGALGLHLGLLLPLLPTLHFGAHATNVNALSRRRRAAAPNVVRRAPVPRDRSSPRGGRHLQGPLFPRLCPRGTGGPPNFTACPPGRSYERPDALHRRSRSTSRLDPSPRRG